MPGFAYVEYGGERHTWCATCRDCGHAATAAEPVPDEGKARGKRAAITLALKELTDSCPRGKYQRYHQTLIPIGLHLFWEWRGDWKSAWLFPAQGGGISLEGMAGPFAKETRVGILIEADTKALREERSILAGRIRAAGWKTVVDLGVGTPATLRAASRESTEATA